MSLPSAEAIINRAAYRRVSPHGYQIISGIDLSTGKRWRMVTQPDSHLKAVHQRSLNAGHQVMRKKETIPFAVLAEARKRFGFTGSFLTWDEDKMAKVSQLMRQEYRDLVAPEFQWRRST